MKTVDRGAKVLDKLRPGWDEHIDLDELQLESPCGCVLGQLYLHEHPHVRPWNRHHAYNRMLEELDIGSPSRLGFSTHGSGTWQNLTHAWKDFIVRRRFDRRRAAAASRETIA